MKNKTFLIAALVASIIFSALAHQNWKLRREKIAIEWEYEVLAQEYARFRSDWIEISRDTLTIDEIKEFLSNSIAPDSISIND